MRISIPLKLTSPNFLYFFHWPPSLSGLPTSFTPSLWNFPLIFSTGGLYFFFSGKAYSSLNTSNRNQFVKLKRKCERKYAYCLFLEKTITFQKLDSNFCQLSLQYLWWDVFQFLFVRKDQPMGENDKVRVFKIYFSNISVQTPVWLKHQNSYTVSGCRTDVY